MVGLVSLPSHVQIPMFHKLVESNILIFLNNVNVHTQVNSNTIRAIVVNLVVNLVVKWVVPKASPPSPQGR